MNPSSRKVILYISMSIDGYIADKNNDLSFLSTVEQEGEDYGYLDFVQSIDTVIIGRKTYEKVLEMGFEYPHTDKKVYVITRTKKPDKGSFEYYSGDIPTLIAKLKLEQGKNIYCDGGAEIVHLLLKEKLIDELIISVIPVMLGSGISLFKEDRPFQKLKLLSSKAFDIGLVQLHYQTIG
jgi:dihydrofolate reductase